jgi:hypothetical protein
MKTAMTAAALLMLAACGPKTAGEAAEDNLHAAADQSDPAAAAVLDNAAENVSDVNSAAAANAMSDQALSDAGNAQTTTQPQPQ